MIVVIDNYDSFTYNLVQYIGDLGYEPVVFRNDQVTVAQIQSLNPTHIVISPGPGRPEDGGISMDVVKQLYQDIPILGVCLGHQIIAEAFGAAVVHAPYLMHGKTSEIHHDGKAIYEALPNPMVATRYHSLIVKKDTLPDCLCVTSTTQDGLVMGVRHMSAPLEGIQFHPESICTPNGRQLLSNFLKPSKKTDKKLKK